MNWLHYLLEANVYLCAFYAFYRLLLRRDTHYMLNRCYLLFASIVSFIVPVMQLGFLKVRPSATAITINSPILVQPSATVTLPTTASSSLTLSELFVYLYLAGACVCLVLLLVKLTKLFFLVRSGSISKNSSYKRVNLPAPAAAFSFFGWLFIGNDSNNNETIIRHEQVHIRQKHSWDIMLTEIIRVICWFNPAAYLVQNDLKAVHEYIADQETADSDNNILAYSTFLINNAYGLSGPSVTHSFFNKNLLKNRIMRLHQKPSGNLARLKYLLTLPLLAGLLCVSTLAVSKTYGWVDLVPHKPAIALNRSIPVIKPQTPADTFRKTHGGKTFNYNNSSVTSKGYKYQETGYLINGKTDFRVIIAEKDGAQAVYFKSKCSSEQIKLLKDKYGYTFPSMDIFSKLPPPPPAPGPPAKVRGPKPVKPVPPAIIPADAPVSPQPADLPPPAPPVKPGSAADTTDVRLNNIYLVPVNGNQPNQLPGGAKEIKIGGKYPIVVINGQVYKMYGAVKPGQRISFSATGGEYVFSANDAYALKKWGPQAAGGVVNLNGSVTVSID